MADGLSITSGVVALVDFAFKSSTVLYGTIRDFQSQDKNVHALKNDLADLRGVLKSLAETVNNNSNINFDTLKLPLLRCGKTCEEYYRQGPAEPHSSPLHRCTRGNSWIGSETGYGLTIPNRSLNGAGEACKEMFLR
ncbi:hypothetical protein CDV31_016703 [Fusarium ambrosium]|uniref:Azaphilone pigments biosynthesis cluster protein L N-terminal domain-containing protein n=1 Tax=Fusarium ambrosium TaxID=131363 RepID=A0A428S3K9_9HYPO|nr:hypothetical protein CDV31_016703 [Fusarium ambrosium]